LPFFSRFSATGWREEQLARGGADDGHLLVVLHGGAGAGCAGAGAGKGAHRPIWAAMTWGWVGACQGARAQ